MKEKLFWCVLRQSGRLSSGLLNSGREIGSKSGYIIVKKQSDGQWMKNYIEMLRVGGLWWCWHGTLPKAVSRITTSKVGCGNVIIFWVWGFSLTWLSGTLPRPRQFWPNKPRMDMEWQGQRLVKERFRGAHLDFGQGKSLFQPKPCWPEFLLGQLSVSFLAAMEKFMT
jgi:hypothetical protein